MGTGALLSVPAAAHADRGKDLYKQDLEILNGRSGALADNFNLPQYDDEGRVVNANGIAEQTQFRELRRGKASVQVLNTWVQSAEGVWSDPVTGSTASAVKLSVLDSPAKSIADLGRPEQIPLISTFGLEPALKRADLVAAAKRKTDGVDYYEFDLALPAVSCVAELATACLPTLVILLSAGIRDGQLHLVRVEATADQWKRSGQALKALRSTLVIDTDA